MGKPYIECPLCHAHLDPGEKCDCQEEKARREKEMEALLRMERGTSQLTFNFRMERG